MHAAAMAGKLGSAATGVELRRGLELGRARNELKADASSGRRDCRRSCFDRILNDPEMQIMPHAIHQLARDAMLVQVAT